MGPDPLGYTILSSSTSNKSQWFESGSSRSLVTALMSCQILGPKKKKGYWWYLLSSYCENTEVLTWPRPGRERSAISWASVFRSNGWWWHGWCAIWRSMLKCRIRSFDVSPTCSLSTWWCDWAIIRNGSRPLVMGVIVLSIRLLAEHTSRTSIICGRLKVVDSWSKKEAVEMADGKYLE